MSDQQIISDRKSLSGYLLRQIENEEIWWLCKSAPFEVHFSSKVTPFRTFAIRALSNGGCASGPFLKNARIGKYNATIVVVTKNGILHANQVIEIV